MKVPHIAAQAELSETEMGLLGRGTWTHAGKMTTDELSLLTGVAGKEPLAGLLDLEYIVHQGLNTDWQYQFALQGQKSETFCDSPLKTQLVQNLMANAGQNVLVPVEIADIDVNQLLPYKPSPYRDALAKADHDFPENYAVKAVAADVDLRAFGATGELDLAQRVVSAAPQNPYAWLELGQFAASKASSLREGQTVNTIGAVSVTQRGQLNSVNAVWESAARKAVTLNPLSEPGWRMLAEAATFNGKTADASNAFWKAYQIDPADSSILNWGLEQFQPKKGGDSASWQKVISLASVPQHVMYIGANLYHVLYDSGQITAANNIWGMADKVFANEKDGKSDDLEKLSLWIAFQEGMGSATYFETKHLTELLPHSSVAFWMEGTQWISFIPPNAEEMMRQAIQLDPSNEFLHRDLGHVLALEGLDAALKELEPFVEVHPNDAAAYEYLAWAYYGLNEYELSAKASKKLLQLRGKFEDLNFYYHLCDSQTRIGDIDGAVESGRHSIQIISTFKEPRSEAGKSIFHAGTAWGYALYGWALLKKGDLDAAMTQCQIAVKLSETNSAAHQCLGEIYFARGQKEEAISEWNEALIDGKGQGPYPKRTDYYSKLAQARLAEVN